MKFYSYPLLLTLLSLLAISQAARNNEEPVLSSTPKAKSLRDHFGVPKSRDLYGPPPSLNLDNFLIKNADNSWTKIPNPAFANEIITPDGKKCDISQHAYYQICYAASSCAECATIESCGWCQSSKKCLPGNIDGCFCKDDCDKDWLESPLQCNSNDTNIWGQMTNISPYATKLITPELTNPKINLTTTEIHPGWDKQPMVIGESVTRKNVTVYNAAENSITSGEINLAERVVRDVPVPTLEMNRETKTYDLVTGKEIPVNSNVTLHGVDTLNKKK